MDQETFASLLDLLNKGNTDITSFNNADYQSMTGGASPQGSNPDFSSIMSKIASSVGSSMPISAGSSPSVSIQQPASNPYGQTASGIQGVSQFSTPNGQSVTQPAGAWASFLPGTLQKTLAPCCVIFIEANGGTIDPLVREFRDKLMTPRNRRGYYRLAGKLVPWMQKSRVVAEAVKRFMVNPMMKSGRWWKDRKDFPILAHMIGFLWMTIYDILGSGKPYKRSNGEWV